MICPTIGRNPCKGASGPALTCMQASQCSGNFCTEAAGYKLQHLSLAGVAEFSAVPLAFRGRLIRELGQDVLLLLARLAAHVLLGIALHRKVSSEQCCDGKVAVQSPFRNDH